MPTYEYQCDACGHAFEKFHSMSAAPIRKCPSCGKNKVRRLIGVGAGLIFKGSGFYITDYREAGYKDQAKADAPPSEASKDSSSSSSTDAAANKSTSDAAKPAGETKSSGDSKPAAESKSSGSSASTGDSKSSSKSES